MYDSEAASPSASSETYSDESVSIVLPLSSLSHKPGVSSIADELKSEVLRHLEKCEHIGSFQTHGVTTYPPNPGLRVHGMGLIPLPLCEEQAWKISERASQNLTDHGNGAPTPTADQNMLELDKSAFETTNPTWQGWIQSITGRVQRTFLIRGNVSAHQDKLLLYKEGAVVEPRIDSETVPGKVGTLLVCLPSKHEGGDICLVYNSEEKAISTATSSQFDQSYAAWFADVRYEVKPVTSGYRFVLTYNLVIDLPSHDFSSAKNVVATTAELRDILNRWKFGGQKVPQKMVYVLHHKYPKASLKLQSLKGTDFPKVTHLQRVAEESGFHLLLARVSRAVEGECEAYSDEDDSLDCPHDLIDVNETTLKLDQVTHLDGTQVAVNINFNEDELVPQDYFAYENKPDHEDVGRHSVSGGRITHWWHRTAILILTEREHFSIVTRGAMNDESKIRDLITDAHRRVFAGSSGEERQELTQLCKSVISAYQDSHLVHNSTSKSRNSAEGNLGGLSDDIIGLVIETALDVEDGALVGEAARAIKREFPSNTWVALGRKASTGSLSARSILRDILLRLPTLQSISTALTHIFHGITSVNEEAEWFTGWISRIVSDKTNSVSHRLTGADGSILAKMASDWGDNFLFTFIENLTSETISNSALLVCLSIALSRYMTPPPASESRISGTTAQDAVHKIMTILGNGFRMESFASQILNKPMVTVSPHSFPLGVKLSPVKVRQSVRPIAELYMFGMEHGMDDAANGMLEAIATQLATYSRINSATIENVPMPLLQDLSAVCKEHLLSQPVFQKLFQSTFHALSTHWILEQPTEPDLCHPRVGCASACPDCMELDRFLMNPRQKSAEFKLRGQRKLHLEHRLYRTQHKRGLTPRGKFAVTKADSESEKIAALAKSRRERGRAFVNSFDQSDLRSLLGDRYDDLTSLEHKKPPVPAVDFSSARANSEDTAATEGAARFGNNISPNIIGNPTRTASSQPPSNPLKRKAGDVINISDNPPATSHISGKTQ